MVRKCSHCGLMGHNSRTCCATYMGGAGAGAGAGAGNNVNGFKLFGVHLSNVHSLDSSITTTSSSFMKKSYSSDWLGAPSSFAACISSSPLMISTISSGHIVGVGCQMTTANDDHHHYSKEAASVVNGYLSDGNLFDDRSQERKKGVAWTEEEHKRFLRGLEKQGKGDWRGISRNYVKTRTPTQVASHAQKYFLRRHQSSLLVDNKKRRSSLFDPPQSGDEEIKVEDDEEDQVNKKRARRDDDYKDKAEDDKDSNNNHQRRLHYCSPPYDEHTVDFITCTSTTTTTTTSSITTQTQSTSLSSLEYLCFNSITTSPEAATATKTTLDSNKKQGGGHELALTLSMGATPDTPSPHPSSFLLAPPITV